MFEPGRTIADRYELVALLGEGGMGVVWRARDTRLGRAVAVKLLAASSLGSDVARKRLIREARAAAALEHEGIIRVYDVGETEDGGAFLVMEFVRGRSLRSELGDGKMRLSDVLYVTVRAARALHVAHQAGIVHRDVKPDNIMIRDTGSVIVVDFGVAKPVSTELIVNAETVAGITSPSLTGAGQLVGTPAYLSPEQARGVDVGAATDQFALAVTAYEAMTGRLPWRGDGVVELVASILRDAPEPLTTSRPGVPAALESVLARALAKAPADRWPDMEAFAGALEQASAELPTEPSMRPSLRSRRPTQNANTPQARDEHLTSGSSGTAVTQGAVTSLPLARVRSKRTALVFGAGFLAALAVGWYTMRSREVANNTPAAVASRSSGLFACPPFAVVGISEPWLGAAASALACERLDLSRGGLDARVSTPAELAGASHEPTKAGMPVFEHAEEREAAITAAKRADKWLDGTLEKTANAYVVRVAMRTADGSEIARGEGRGVEIFEAVREAMKPVLGAPDKEESAMLREWLDVGSLDEALDLLDMRTAVLIEDPVSLKEACARIDALTDLLPRVRYLANSTCAKKLRTGTLTDPPPEVDASSPGALITTSLAQWTTGGVAAVRERAARLEQERDRTSSVEGKARLAAAAAELYNAIGDERARDLARSAIQLTPKAVDWRTSAWHRVAFSSEGDPALSIVMAAWQPWEPVSQSLRTSRDLLADAEARGRYARRAHLLSQRSFYAYGYGIELLGQGRIEEARGIAERAQDELLRMDILLAEARYGAVLTKVPRLLTELPASDETASLAFRVAHVGVRASLTLERPADFVDTLVTRWVESDPHHVVDGVVPFTSLVTICCLAPRPIGRRCIDRLQKLRAEAKLPTIFSSADTVVAGAARFVLDDYRGATKAWRTLLRTPAWIQDPIRDPMAIAFDRSEEPDLATEIDSPTLALVDFPRTAEIAWVRAARRASSRGDVATARRLAQAVVDKWRFADEDVPAMREMKVLLAKLPK